MSTEEHNPENVKGVAGAEVFVPSFLLAKGMCLVDTPCLGSVFSGNTAVSRVGMDHFTEDWLCTTCCSILDTNLRCLTTCVMSG
jgi:hypothetical protein